MNLEQLSLDKLIPHPDNPNVMSPEQMDKLQNHIARTGRYEPLIVRPHPRQNDAWEILNGHHRCRILRRLNHTTAACLVWHIDDSEALMLLATLNRLNGRDDPHKRAALLRQLQQRYDHKNLLRRIPESSRELTRRLALNQQPRLTPPEQTPDLPQALTFFLTADQLRLVNTALQHMKQRRKEQNLHPGRRADWLLDLAQTVINPGEQHAHA